MLTFLSLILIVFILFFPLLLVLDHQAVTGTTATSSNQPVPGRIEGINERRTGGRR
jgi:hypothetical protein